MRFCPNCGKEIPIVKEPEAETAGHKEHEIIDRATSVIKNTFSQDRKKMKLYRQWVEHAGLPQDDIPRIAEEAPEAPAIERRRGQRQQIPMVYIVLGVAIILFIIAIAIILITSLSS